MSGQGRAGTHVSRHSAIVEQLGRDITSGKLPEGLILRSEDLELQYGVTRSVMREGLRVLETLGMVGSRRSVGVFIRPAAEWNVFDPLVVRWRLDGSGRVDIVAGGYEDWAKRKTKGPSTAFGGPPPPEGEDCSVASI